MFRLWTNKIGRWLLVMGLVLPWVLVPKQAYACSCVELSSPEVGFNQSAAVFEGTVTAVSRPSQLQYFVDELISYVPFVGGHNFYDWYNTAVTIDVHQAWKGVDVDQVTLFTGRGGGDCGYGFTVGGNYLVYAYEHYESEGRLVTDICSNTKPAGSAADDLVFLSTQPTLPLTAAPWDFRGMGCLGVLIITAVVGGSWFVARRRRGVKIES